MPTGRTTTESLNDSLPTAIAAAVNIREFKGVMTQLVRRENLEPGTGLTWNEVGIDAINAQSVGNDTDLEDNPQQLSDTLRSITPTISGLSTFVLDQVAERISKKSFARLARVGQDAIQRKKDEDLITMGQGATTDLGATATVLTSGEIAAGSFRVTSNTTEPGTPPIYAVFQGFGIKHLWDELGAPVGTYEISNGLSRDVFEKGIRAKYEIGGSMVIEDGNIPVVSNDAEGIVFAREGIILVQGRAPRMKTERFEGRGGGGTMVYHYDDYGSGEGGSAGMWLYSVTHDATVPTG